MDLTKDVVDKVLEGYYQGKVSLAESVDAAPSEYKAAWLKAVSQFTNVTESKVAKDKDAPEEEPANETAMYPSPKDEITDWKCPATGETIKVYREICQDWQETLSCFQSICVKYPVIDQTPVITTELESKAGSKTATVVDFNSNTVKIGNSEFEFQGKTFGDKLRNLRNTLSTMFDINTVAHIINSVAQTKKANVQFDFGKIEVGEKIWLHKSAFTVGSDIMYGEVKDVAYKNDGSVLVTVHDSRGKVGYITDLSIVLHKQ